MPFDGIDRHQAKTMNNNEQGTLSDEQAAKVEAEKSVDEARAAATKDIDKALTHAIRFVKRNQFYSIVAGLQLLVKYAPSVLASAFKEVPKSTLLKLLFKMTLLAVKYLLGNIFLCVPGTHRFRQRYQKASVEFARTRLKEYNGLSSIDTTTKALLSRSVRHSINRVQMIEQWAAASSRYFSMKLPLLLAVITTPFFVRHWIHPSLSNIGWLLVTAGGIVICLVSIVIFMIIPIVFLVLHKYETLVSSCIIIFIISAALIIPHYLIPAHSLDSQISNYMMLCFFASAEALWVSVFVAVGVIRLLNFRISRHYPDAIVVDGFLGILIDLETKPKEWTKMSYRRQLMQSLEGVAVVIESCLWRPLASGDTDTDTWMRQELKKVAHYLRSTKRWILKPMSDTRENFKRHIATNFVHAATGEWDGLELLEIDASTHREMRQARFLAFSRTIVVGSLISGLIWLVRHLPLLGIPTAALYLGPAYILLSWIYLLDPSIANKTDLIKNLRDFLPERKQGEKH